LEQARRNVVSFQAKINHDQHRITELQAALAAMDKQLDNDKGENK
jgi:hypothetical protein